MANLMLKSLKFARILNGRLSSNSLKPLYIFNKRHITQYLQKTKETRYYATAAYNYQPKEDVTLKKNIALSNAAKKDIHSIDDALSKIDSAIRRTGRTQMKNLLQAFSMVTDKAMTSSTHALYLIRCCKFCIDEPPSKRIDVVNEIWNKYQEFGIKYDVRHYNSLLDVHIANGLDFDPAEILRSMEEVNIEPNKDTYMLVMKKYCQDGNIVGASEILEHMKKEGLSADEKVFNNLIEGHVKNNDFAGAMEIVEVMKASNLQPNADTYCILACGYAAMGEKEEMLSCLTKCNEKGRAEHYLKVIDALATSGNHKFIEEVLPLIPNKDIYAHDYINAMVELIHKGQFDVAFKLAVEVCKQDYNESSNIFVKQLIRRQMPISTILDYCQNFFDKGLNKFTYMIASKVAMDLGHTDYALILLKRMIETGMHVKSSTIHELFSSLKAKNSPKADIWSILKQLSELGIPVNIETYVEYVYPLLGAIQPEEVLQNIKESGQVVGIAANALFAHYCNIGELEFACYLTENYSISPTHKFNIESFVNDYFGLNKEDMNSYIKILRHIFMEIDESLNHAEIQGKLLAKLIINRPGILEALFKRYEDLRFSHQALEICDEIISRKNPNRQFIVIKIKNIIVEREKFFGKENLSTEDEVRYIKNLQAQNVPCRIFLTKRILHHLRTKNVDRASELLALFDEMKLTYSPLIYSNMITMYAAVGDMEKAKEVCTKLKNEFPDFQLDIIRTLDYAIGLMKYEQFDDGLEILKHFLKEPYTYSSKENLWKTVRRMNMYLNDVSDIEFVRKTIDLLLPLSTIFGSKKIFLEPLVHYYLKRNDLQSAFQEFKNIIVKHRTLTCLGPILRKCVFLEDKDILHKAVDLAIGFSGKSHVLLELALIFVEHQNFEKAAKIIESLGMDANPADLDEIFSKLSQQNKILEIEQLLNITRTLSHIDRQNLYMHAFRACAQRNDSGRAMKLLAKLNEEVEEPRSEIVNFVEDLLKKQDQTDFSSASFSPASNSEPVTFTNAFLSQLKAGNAMGALEELSFLKKGYIRTLPLNTVTDLIDLCLQQDCTAKLSMNVQAMSYIIENVREILRPILEKYSEAGDVKKMAAICNFMPDFSLMSLNFNTYFSKAFIVSGQHETLLSELEQRTDKKNKLFSSLAFQELMKFPEYEERIFNLAVTYMKNNYTAPMAYLFSHYFIKGNFEKAYEIYKNYEFPADKNDEIIKHVKETENITIALKYVDFMKETKTRQRSKGRAFGTALDLLVSKEMYEEAVKLVVESEKLNLELHKYYIKPLLNLKNILEKDNKPVPFNVPMDEVSNSA